MRDEDSLRAMNEVADLLTRMNEIIVRLGETVPQALKGL
jgi:hypothetical protein